MDKKLPILNVFSLTRKYPTVERLSRSLEQIHKEHMEPYDWLFVADDDTYVVVENLRHFLSSKNHSEPHYLGFPFSMNKFQWNHGGSGYAISKPALKIYVERGLGSEMNSASPCQRNGRYRHADIEVGSCFSLVGIKPEPTHDEKHRQRFIKENPIKILNDIRTGEITLYGYRDIITDPPRVS